VSLAGQFPQSQRDSATAELDQQRLQNQKTLTWLESKTELWEQEKPALFSQEQQQQETATQLQKEILNLSQKERNRRRKAEYHQSAERRARESDFDKE